MVSFIGIAFFHIFAHQISIHAGFIWAVVRPLLSQIWFDFADICARGSIFSRRKQCLKNLWNIWIFTRMGRTQRLYFGPNLNHRYPLKMAKTEGNKYFPGKALTIRLSRCVKNQGPIFSPLSRKNTIFTLFVLFLVGNKVGVTRSKVRIKIWHNLFYQHNSWST